MIINVIYLYYRSLQAPRPECSYVLYVQAYHLSSQQNVLKIRSNVIYIHIIINNTRVQCSQTSQITVKS